MAFQKHMGRRISPTTPQISEQFQEGEKGACLLQPEEGDPARTLVAAFAVETRVPSCQVSCSATLTPSQPKKKKAPPNPREKTCAGQQVVELSPPSSEGEGILTFAKMGPVFYESDSEREL